MEERRGNMGMGCDLSFFHGLTGKSEILACF